MVETVEIQQPETTNEAPVVEEKSNSEVKPEWLPDKFQSAEEMAKAYGELENKLGQPNPETPEPIKEDTKSDMEIADKAVESAGLDMGTLQQEFDTTGTLAETSYEALAKAGIPKDYVDQFIAGQNAVKASQESEVKGLVGGDEGYSEMTSWAGQNMVDIISSFSFLTNFNNITRGLVEFKSILYFLSLIIFFLVLNVIFIDELKD